jgi:hypothetical protein
MFNRNGLLVVYNGFTSELKMSMAQGAFSRLGAGPGNHRLRRERMGAVSAPMNPIL